MYMGADLVQRETLTTLVAVYNHSIEQIEQAYGLLDSAKDNLKKTFVYDYFKVTPDNHYGDFKDKLAKVKKEIKTQAWRVIVDRLEIRRILSIKRREELDKQLAGERHYGETPDELPEITEANIIDMFQNASSKATDYARESVYEVFDWLRPEHGRTADLKTNKKWMIGKKVIIGYAVEPGYRGKGTFRASYHREKNLTALDNVFHMLDGRGPVKSHHGPLYDAINNSPDGTGETDFFRFRACKNGNLHVEFKRMDLVDKINKMAGDSTRIGR